MFLQLGGRWQGGRKSVNLLLPSHKGVCGKCDWCCELRYV